MQKRMSPPAARTGLLTNTLAGLLLAASLAQPAVQPALAQSNDEGNDQSALPYLEINPLFSSATRRPIPLAEVLASVSIITRAQIEQAGAYDVAELLASQPGLRSPAMAGRGRCARCSCAARIPNRW